MDTEPSTQVGAELCFACCACCACMLWVLPCPVWGSILLIHFRSTHPAANKLILAHTPLPLPFSPNLCLPARLPACSAAPLSLCPGWTWLAWLPASPRTRALTLASSPRSSPPRDPSTPTRCAGQACWMHAGQHWQDSQQCAQLGTLRQQLACSFCPALRPLPPKKHKDQLRCRLKPTHTNRHSPLLPASAACLPARPPTAGAQPPVGCGTAA
jgi:hypothetical protein